jgi:hypothetical protein
MSAAAWNARTDLDKVYYRNLERITGKTFVKQRLHRRRDPHGRSGSRAVTLQ